MGDRNNSAAKAIIFCSTKRMCHGWVEGDRSGGPGGWGFRLAFTFFRVRIIREGAFDLLGFSTHPRGLSFLLMLGVSVPSPKDLVISLDERRTTWEILQATSQVLLIQHGVHLHSPTVVRAVVRCDQLQRDLQRAGVPCAAIHGDKGQREREHVGGPKEV